MRLQVFVTSATPKSVFVVELPIPGKCLSVVRTPAARWASISIVARVDDDVRVGRERPIERADRGAPGVHVEIDDRREVQVEPGVGERRRRSPSPRPGAVATLLRPISASDATAGNPCAGERRVTIPPS